MERREFLKGSAALCLAFDAFLIAGCTNYKSISAEETNNKLKIKKADFAEYKFVLVKSGKLSSPVYLSKESDNQFTAVLMLCTHKQCELKPAGNVLLCPCHGSEFSLTGQVLKEPADKNLVRYETSVDEQNIYIHLK